MSQLPRAIALGLLVVTAAAVLGCSDSSDKTVAAAAQAPTPNATPADATAAVCGNGRITISGSTAIQPLLSAAATMYEESCPGTLVIVEGGGSGVGLSEVAQGIVQIGASDFKAEESNIGGLVDHVIAREGFAVVTNQDVPVRNLTQRQAAAIFTCRTTSWKDVGGPDEPIVVLLRPLTSGTRTVFRNLVLQGAPECQSGTTLTEDSSEAVRLAVEQTPGAISVIGFAYFAVPSAKTALDIVSYERAQPTLANIADGAYKITSDANLYTKGEPTGLAKAFLDYLLSDDIQRQLIPSLNFGSVR